MTDADVPRGHDPDDWFAEQAGRSAAANKIDEWLAEAPPRRADRYRRGLSLNPRTAAAGGVVLVALLVIGLAAGGVFSSSSPSRTAPPTTAPTTAPTTGTHTTTPPPAAVAVPTSPLKPGDTGTQVKLLQRALVRLAYYSGKVDGDYGPATTEAVKTFQLAAKLTADGIAGPQTLRALKKAVAKS
jgi:hypothetical protein